MEMPTQTEIIIKGIDRQKLGQVCAKIRGGFARRSPTRAKASVTPARITLKEGKKK